MDFEIPMEHVYDVAATRLSRLDLGSFRWTVGRDDLRLTCTVSADLPEAQYTLRAHVGGVTVSGQPWRFEELGRVMLWGLWAAAVRERNRQRRLKSSFGAL